MQEEDFLLSMKEALEDSLETIDGQAVDWNSSELGKITDPEKKLKRLKWRLNDALERVKVRLKDPDTNYRCGLYLHDGSRQYGYTFEQLEHLLDEYEKPFSVFYKSDWGFTSLIKWLYEVSRTSIGDLHGDLPKHVVVTYHRPWDFETDEKIDEVHKRYDAFWDRVERLFYKENRAKRPSIWSKVKGLFKKEN